MDCLFCGSEIERSIDTFNYLWVHNPEPARDAYCGYGDGTVAIPADPMERIKELRREWAEATGDDPDHYSQLSGEDWQVGLGEDGAKEMVVLLHMIETLELWEYIVKISETGEELARDE